MSISIIITSVNVCKHVCRYIVVVVVVVEDTIFWLSPSIESCNWIDFISVAYASCTTVYQCRTIKVEHKTDIFQDVKLNRVTCTVYIFLSQAIGIWYMCANKHYWQKIRNRETEPVVIILIQPKSEKTGKGRGNEKAWDEKREKERGEEGEGMRGHEMKREKKRGEGRIQRLYTRIHNDLTILIRP